MKERIKELIEIYKSLGVKNIAAYTVLENLENLLKSYSEDMVEQSLNIIKNITLQDGVNTELSKSQSLITETCNEIKEMLLEKNRKYGNSALSPKRIFSKASSIEQINVRIDDKLSRIESAQTDDIEDPVFDLLGYLILRKVAEKINKEK